MKYLLIILMLIPAFTFSQQPSGIITYEEVRISDSSNDEDISFHFNMQLPQEEKQRLTAKLHGTIKRTRYLYFTPSTTWTHCLQKSAEKGVISAVDVVRTYKDSTLGHNLLLDIGENEFGGQEVASLTRFPLHVRRLERPIHIGFNRTDTSRVILGYKCYAYVNPEEPGTRYWMTDELDLPKMNQSGFIPSTSNLTGVLLAYEKQEEKRFTEATAIDFCPLDEMALRHTPLLELRPEMVRQ